ncbi:hypothetical protein BS47DRAFT_411443 [Hydnum rufescens UP504]|uniref:Uncharacterized protein n=1 Tax=Hydnum rufescens UP504 TaxID=1448309 RepID=A0A9P6BAQ0_9AGAM|nr:hypothetical protein BS47DRAFT_411443 [Hydnum rufescens UP504]
MTSHLNIRDDMVECLVNTSVRLRGILLTRQKYVCIVRFEHIRCTRSSVLYINYLMSTSVADYGSHCNSHGSPSVCPVGSTESYRPKPRRKNAQGALAERQAMSLRGEVLGQRNVSIQYGRK